jgi:putative transposase
VPLIEAAPPAESFAVPASASPNLPVVTVARRPPSRADSACADGRAVLMRLLADMIGTCGSSGYATAELSAQLHAGELSDAAMSAAQAANRKPRAGRGVAISARTLYRWHASYLASGWWGLLPKASEAKPLAAIGDDVAAVLQGYASKTGQARNLTHVAQAVTKALGRPFDDWRRLYDQARRALGKVDKVQLIKARHTGADRAARLPFKRRDTSAFAPLDIVLIDGHTFKAKVRHPDHGQPFAPEVSVVKDAATRKVIGWSVSLSESTMAVGDAVCHAVRTHGVPAMLYSDNGAGEIGKQLDCPVDGLYARLAIEHRTGMPGHPQARGLLERSWRTHMIRCARQFDTYQGKDVDRATHRTVSLELQREQRAVDRARKTGDVVTLSRKVPSWHVFIAAVEQSIADYNGEHRHRSLPKHIDGPHAGLHMTPDEAWKAMLVADDVVKPDASEVRMLFMPSKLATAQRGEVRFLNQVYANSELMQVDGERVSVRYDIHDASRVWVWRVSGEFVCEAALDANRSDFFPKAAVELAREKRVR